ncbi:MAG: DNA repair protein RecN [Bacteroidia bacterium]|nr:DNA repair protein RecN [Bacteroidia bacterium]
MLKHLSVQNYVLIDQLDIQFGKGLSIITGETGAGKSILLGALGLMLGQRADTDLLLDKKKKCIVEGVFDIRSYDLQSFFSDKELDFEEDCTIRREINPEGKSRAFVNDSPVNLSLLKEITSRLVDIHSQHETLLLSDSRFQLNVTDAYAQNRKQLENYRTAYTAWRQAKKVLAQLREDEQKSKADLDYLKFQYEEISGLKLMDGEQEMLESEQDKLAHAEDILQQLDRVLHVLRDGDDNVVAHLNMVNQVLSGLQKFDSSFNLLNERIQTAIIEIKDIHGELEHYTGTLQADPSRLEQIGERLGSIYAMQKKHRLSSVKELIQLQTELEEKISRISSLDDHLLDASKELEIAEKQLKKEGEALTQSRRNAVPGIEKEIMKQLADLSMPHALLRVAVVDEAEGVFSSDGMEKIQFLFSANKGGDFKELSKVASGGEMSRLMLCIKSVLARLSAMPTVIFDEIDTGISGETAARVGSILKQMGRKHQVLAITHLPQMASKGDEHFLVYKEVKKGTTRSFLRKLTEAERINEIARMLSGEELTTAALENARELLNQ